MTIPDPYRTPTAALLEPSDEPAFSVDDLYLYRGVTLLLVATILLALDGPATVVMVVVDILAPQARDHAVVDWINPTLRGASAFLLGVAGLCFFCSQRSGWLQPLGIAILAGVAGYCIYPFVGFDFSVSAMLTRKVVVPEVMRAMAITAAALVLRRTVDEPLRPLVFHLTFAGIVAIWIETIGIILHFQRRSELMFLPNRPDMPWGEPWLALTWWAYPLGLLAAGTLLSVAAFWVRRGLWEQGVAAAQAERERAELAAAERPAN